jgi:hypothetical protein
MFDQFRAAYNSIKKGSRKPSRLAPLFRAIKAYEAEQTMALLKNIEKVMHQVMMIKKVGVKNVIKKYGMAFTILQTEIMEQYQYLESKSKERGVFEPAPRARPRPEPSKRKATQIPPPPPDLDMLQSSIPPPPPDPDMLKPETKKPKSFKLQPLPPLYSECVIDAPEARKILGKLMQEINLITQKQITGKCVIDGKVAATDSVVFTTIAWAFERTGNMQIQPAGEADYSSVKKNGRIYIAGHGEKGGYASGYKPPSKSGLKHFDRPVKGSLLYQICQAMTHPETGIPIASDPVYIIYTRCHAGDVLKGDSYVKQLSQALSKHKKRPNIFVIGCKTNTIKSPITGDRIFTRLSDQKHRESLKEFEKYFKGKLKLEEEYKFLASELKEEPQKIELALYTTMRTMARAFLKTDIRIALGAYGYNIDDYQIYHKGSEIQLRNRKELVLQEALFSPLVFNLTERIFALR